MIMSELIPQAASAWTVQFVSLKKKKKSDTYKLLLSNTVPLARWEISKGPLITKEKHLAFL